MSATAFYEARTKVAKEGAVALALGNKLCDRMRKLGQFWMFILQDEHKLISSASATTHNFAALVRAHHSAVLHTQHLAGTNEED